MSIDKPYEKNVLVDIEPATGFNNELKFQNFASPTASSPPNANEMSTGIDDDQSKKIDSSSIWSLDYFKQFFDVDTDTVVTRIVASMYPRKGVNYVQNYISNKPDLYGPFWICITLVFAIAISGNMANYLQSAARRQSYHWKYDFHAVSSSATAIFLYAWIVPIIVWATLKYQRSTAGGNIDAAEQQLTQQFELSLLELICVYGYSLSVYVPISVLWLIQINAIQWILVFVGASLSGYVLMTSISPAFGEKNFFLLLIFLCLHVLLAVGFMLYFFHVPPIVEDVKG